MRFLGTILILAFASGAVAAPSRTVRDPVTRNIGLTCQWKAKCMKQQRIAMRDALNYLAVAKPPSWRLQTCNRNASRGPLRVDWIGFNNCIRNEALRPPAPPKKKRLKIF